MVEQRAEEVLTCTKLIEYSRAYQIDFASNNSRVLQCTRNGKMAIYDLDVYCLVEQAENEKRRRPRMKKPRAAEGSKMSVRQ
jgi:hypothetical protein